MSVVKKGWLVAVLLSSMGLRAEEGAQLQDLEKKFSILMQEVSDLKKEKSMASVNPLAGVTLGGYGEFVYQAFDKQTDAGGASGKRNTLDLYRFVIYAGYQFNDKFVLNSEIEFEHAAEDKRGEISVEMMTLDYLWAAPLSLRAGLLLVPVGYLNEAHEPTVYHGVNRPNVEKNIIPTTWRENGAGFFGQAGPVSYRSYVVNGFQAVNDAAVTGKAGNVKGYSASSGLRDGRQKGSNALAEDMAWVSRVDYSVVPGVSVGGSYYTGNAGQSARVSAQELKARTTLWETHGDVQWQGVELRGLYSCVLVGDVALINQAQGVTGMASVGEKMWGAYGQVAYNVLAHMRGARYLAPFVRYERYNTQARVPTGFMANPANDRTEMIYGLTFRPIPKIVLKGEYQNNRNRADSGVDQWNLGVGYAF